MTGCPRSGTTPVGSNLALAPHARYLYEPFNPNFGMRSISRFFEVPGANGFSPQRLDACIDDIRRVRLDLKRFDWPRETGVRRLVKRVIGGRASVAYALCRLDWSLDTVIWKDPTAAFTAQQAALRHDIPVIVTLRPAPAVAASYKRMQWDSSLPTVIDSLSQVGIAYPDLMRDYGRYVSERAVGAALLWYVINATLLRWAGSAPLIRFLNLQDSIDRPVETYRGLFELLGLAWTPGVESRLRRRYAGEGKRPPSETLPQRAHVAGRSLGDVNTYGRKLLTPDETRIVEEIAADLWPRLTAASLSADGLAKAGPSGAPRGLVAA